MPTTTVDLMTEQNRMKTRIVRYGIVAAIATLASLGHSRFSAAQPTRITAASDTEFANQVRSADAGATRDRELLDAQNMAPFDLMWGAE